MVQTTLKIPVTEKGEVARVLCNLPVLEADLCKSVELANMPAMFSSAFYMIKNSLLVRVFTAAKIILYEARRCHYFK